MDKLKNTPLKQIIELFNILEPKQYHDTNEFDVPELKDIFIRFVKYSLKTAGSSIRSLHIVPLGWSSTRFVRFHYTYWQALRSTLKLNINVQLKRSTLMLKLNVQLLCST